MDNIVRTIYGSFLQTCQYTGRPWVKKPSSTLNEKFGIQASALPSVNEVPAVKYFAIGNGGHEFDTQTGGTTFPALKQHKATDAALFKHLPFILREVANDLTPEQRAKYAMRRQEEWGGKQYFAYYLKRIDYTGVTPAMNSVAVVNGVKTITEFAPNTSNLNPTPPDLDSTGVNLVDGNYVNASAPVQLALSEDEATELREVATIMFNNDNLAIISEVALVSGLDKTVPSPASGGGTINFLEAVCAQVTSFVGCFFAVKFNNANNALVLDIGATEPLLDLS